MTTRPYLALCRAGDRSLHPSWITGGHRNFDLAVSSYGSGDVDTNELVFLHREKGPKWQGFYNCLVEHEALIRNYKYVWLSDDDILADAPTLSEMFDIAAALDLDLAQPSLTLDSYSTHVIVFQHSQFIVRFTNFVEVMAPFFSAKLLDRVLRIYGTQMRDSISSFGFDLLWPRLSELGRIAIIDKTPVRHTRPLGATAKPKEAAGLEADSIYQLSKAAGLSPMDELGMTSAKYFIESDTDMMTYGGIGTDQKLVSFSDDGQEANEFLRRLRQSVSGMRINELQRSHYLERHWNFLTKRLRPYKSSNVGRILQDRHRDWAAAPRG